MTKETPARRASRLKYRSKPEVQTLMKETGRKYREKNRRLIRKRTSNLASNDTVTQETLVLGPYKEPLRKVEGGYGYQGALTFNVLGQVQCHECGDLLDNLASHVYQMHKISAAQYREKYQLSKRTRLISERFREEKKNKHLAYLQTLSRDERDKYRARALQRMAEVNELRKKQSWKRADTSLEHKNKLGICPDQLLNIIRKGYEYYGHVPTYREFERLYGYRYHEPIRLTFGSYTLAVAKAGYEYPIRKGGATKGVPRPKYEDEELLEALSIFYTVHGRIPTASDCKRGLLPSYDAYKRRWGGFPEARRKAQVPDFLSVRGNSTLKLT